MKSRIFQKTLLTLLCLLLFFCLHGVVSASEASPHRGYLLGEDAVEYRTLIEKSLKKEADSIHEDIQLLVNPAYDCWIETDTIFVEYEMDYRSLREFGTDESGSFLPPRYADKPIFLAPLIGKIGEEMRIIGYIGFHRSSNGVYPTERSVTQVNGAFRNGEEHHYLEQLTDDELLSRLLSEKGAGEAQEILLVRLLVGNSVDRIAAVKTDSGVFVLDLTDKAWDDNEPELYKMDEFASMLDAKEEVRTENFRETAATTLLVIGARLLGALLIALVGIGLLVTVIVLVIRKLIRKRRAAQKE